MSIIRFFQLKHWYEHFYDPNFVQNLIQTHSKRLFKHAIRCFHQF